MYTHMHIHELIICIDLFNLVTLPHKIQSDYLKASQLTKENIPENKGCPICSRGISFKINVR